MYCLPYEATVFTHFYLHVKVLYEKIFTRGISQVFFVSFEKSWNCPSCAPPCIPLRLSHSVRLLMSQCPSSSHLFPTVSLSICLLSPAVLGKNSAFIVSPLPFFHPHGCQSHNFRTHKLTANSKWWNDWWLQWYLCSQISGSYTFSPVLLFLIPSCSTFLLLPQERKYTHTHTSCIFLPAKGGARWGDPSKWQRRSAAASRTTMCGYVFAFEDDLVSQSFTHPLVPYSDICSRSRPALFW